MITETLDAKGLNCPLPIVKAKKAISKLNSGDVLEIIATDPGSVEDFESFSRATGHAISELKEEQGVYRIFLTVGG